MSAIFGIFYTDGRPVEMDLLKRMESSMSYWGSHGRGIWTSESVGVGHLMLHNTPEARLETMPKKNTRQDLVLSAHVRIDNRDDLFETLGIEKPGQDQITDGDLILRAYEKWGHDCTLHLIGDWAFSLWDSQHRSLFLAREHFGISSLYYYFDTPFFAFASSIKALLALPRIHPDPNIFPIAQVLAAWPELGQETSYQGIKRLPAGHRLQVSDRGVHVERYWHWRNVKPVRFSRDEDYVHEFNIVFEKAVRSRLRTSKKAGATLSGGLDSGSVTAVAAGQKDLINENFPVFSAVPCHDTEGLVPQSAFGDERPYIESTASHLGNVKVNYITAENISPVQGLRRLFNLSEDINTAATNHFWISALLEKAQAAGIDALLTGQMGNATISWKGNLHIAGLARQGRIKDAWRELMALHNNTDRPLWRLAASQIIKPFLPLSSLDRIWQPLLGYNPLKEYSPLRVDFIKRSGLIQKMYQYDRDPNFRLLPDPVKNRDMLFRFMSSCAGSYWQEIGMGYGIEVRDPTADKRVIEFCLGIPDDQYFKNGQSRHLIKRAMAGRITRAVLHNARKGYQAADIGQRIKDHFEETEALIKEIGRYSLARDMLDLQRMRSILNSSRIGLSQKTNNLIASVLMRGLETGMLFDKYY